MPVVHGVDIPSPPRSGRAAAGGSGRYEPERPGHVASGRSPTGWGRPAPDREQGGRRLFVGVLWTLSLMGFLAAGSLMMELGRNAMEEGPSVFPSSQRVHVVAPGETLSGIAGTHGLGLDSLLAVGSNRTRFPNPDRIRPGQTVELP